MKTNKTEKSMLQKQLEFEMLQEEARYEKMRKISFKVSIIAIIISLTAIVLSICK